MPGNAISLYYHHSVRKFGLQHSNSPAILRSCWDLCIIFVDNNRQDKFGQRHENGLKEDYKLSGFLATLFITSTCHDDVIKWKHFPRYWSFVWGIHRGPVNSPHEGQWRGTSMCASINSWVNDGEASDLRRHHAHYDVNVMCEMKCITRDSSVYRVYNFSYSSHLIHVSWYNFAYCNCVESDFKISNVFWHKGYALITSDLELSEHSPILLIRSVLEKWNLHAYSDSSSATKNRTLHKICTSKHYDWLELSINSLYVTLN